MPLHALFIGINQYPQDPSIAELQYAKRDASELHALFRHGLGHDENNIHLLEEPSAMASLAKLREIGAKVRANDTFLFFFAGHGHQAGQDQLLLMPGAIRQDLLEGEVGVDVLSLQQMVRATQRWPQVQSVFMLDACRTDLHKTDAATGSRDSDTQSFSPQVQAVLAGITGRFTGGYASEETQNNQNYTPQTQKANSPPALVLNGCQDGQQCYELKHLKRGQLSYNFGSWIQEGKKAGKPRVLGRRAEIEINALIAKNASQAAQGNQAAKVQQVWLSADTEVVLYVPLFQVGWEDRAAPAEKLTPAQPISTGPSATKYDERLWAIACRKNTEASYEEYIKQAPDDAQHIDEAMARLDELINGPARAAVTAAETQKVAAANLEASREARAEQERSERLAQAQCQAEQARAEFVRPGRVFRDAPWAPEMFIIPAGSFRMGSDKYSDEQPIHEVTIAKPFALGKYAVTFDDYDRYAQAAGVEKPSDQGWGRGSRPVINVSWDDAQAYIKWLNEQPEIRQSLQGQKYRLPSEAEWEYAVRAGTTTAFSTGDQITTEQANFDGNYSHNGSGKSGKYLQKTTPVGSYPANPWGLSDMSGNVWEWVQDCWNESYQGAPSNRKPWQVENCTRRVLRGGSWNNSPVSLRSTDRGRSTATNRDNYTGFRLARTAP